MSAYIFEDINWETHAFVDLYFLYRVLYLLKIVHDRLWACTIFGNAYRCEFVMCVVNLPPLSCWWTLNIFTFRFENGVCQQRLFSATRCLLECSVLLFAIDISCCVHCPLLNRTATAAFHWPVEILLYLLELRYQSLFSSNFRKFSIIHNSKVDAKKKTYIILILLIKQINSTLRFAQIQNLHAKSLHHNLSHWAASAKLTAVLTLLTAPSQARQWRLIRRKRD